MKAYQKERIENAICFFAREHFKLTKKLTWSMHIYKYLAFFEFRLFEKNGEMPLGFHYRAMERGPVPIELYEKRCDLQSKLFVFEKINQDEERYQVKATAVPNMDYFTDDEIAEMGYLIDFFAQKWVDTKVMSDASHQSIRGWRRAHKRQPNDLIRPDDTFENIHEKLISELSAPEEHFLISEALSPSDQLACL